MCTLHDAAESELPKFIIEYLGEIKIEFEIFLTYLSGGRHGFISWKNRGWKSRDTVPLTPVNMLGAQAMRRRSRSRLSGTWWCGPAKLAPPSNTWTWPRRISTSHQALTSRYTRRSTWQHRAWFPYVHKQETYYASWQHFYLWLLANCRQNNQQASHKINTTLKPHNKHKRLAIQ